jgi:hypothetical protein
MLRYVLGITDHRPNIQPPALLHGGARVLPQEAGRQHVADPVLRHATEQHCIGLSLDGPRKRDAIRSSWLPFVRNSRTNIYDFNDFPHNGVYGITNAWAGGLCEPPAFFVELGHSARRPQPRQVGKGGPWPAGAFQVYDGVPSKPFVPDAFGMTTAIVHAPSAGRGGKPAGLGEERVEAREHGAHRGNCAGAIAFPVSAPPASPGLVLDHRLELAAEPLVKGFRGLGGGEIRLRDTGRLVRKAAMQTDLQRRSIRAPDGCKINESHQLYLTGLFLVLGL